jgi:hypothetical protein
MTRYSPVYPLNRPATHPTALEWKSGTVRFGDLILMGASEEIFNQVKSKIWSSGHSNSYVWLAQTTRYSPVYQLNRRTTPPTALEWKSGTVRFGGLILMVASEEMFSHVKSKIWSSGHSNSYVWLAQTTRYSPVYPLNRPTTPPTALEWKSGTVRFGGLILMVAKEGMFTHKK